MHVNLLEKQEKPIHYRILYFKNKLFVAQVKKLEGEVMNKAFCIFIT